MISESISKLDLSLVKEIILICIKDHIKNLLLLKILKILSKVMLKIKLVSLYFK